MGAMPQVPTVYEVLEEMAITVRSCRPHYCSFLVAFKFHRLLTIYHRQDRHFLRWMD